MGRTWKIKSEGGWWLHKTRKGRSQDRGWGLKRLDCTVWKGGACHPASPRYPYSCRPFQAGLRGRCPSAPGRGHTCDSEESEVPQSGMEHCPSRKPSSKKQLSIITGWSRRQSPTTWLRNLSPKTEWLRLGVYTTEWSFHCQENGL